MRLAKNLTQDELADDFNNNYGYSFTKATISQYENDKRIPEISALSKFAEYFNVSLDYLLCNDAFIIREMQETYNASNSANISFEDIVSMTESLINSKKLMFDNKLIDKEKEIILKNCLDVTIELMKRTGGKIE